MENREKYRRLKDELTVVEKKIELKKKELEELETEQAAILKKLSEDSDEKHEADVLAMVYEQRRGK